MKAFPQPDGYQLRDWTAQDIDAVTELDSLVFDQDAWSPEMFRHEFMLAQQENPDRFYGVIEAPDGKIAGFAGLMLGHPFADIHTIGVRPDHTGIGLGRMLLDWMITTAQAHNIQDVLLEVRASNARAQDLYQRAGFDHIHTRPKYYPGGEDAWVMRKQLRDPQPSSASQLSPRGSE